MRIGRGVAIDLQQRSGGRRVADLAERANRSRPATLRSPLDSSGSSTGQRRADPSERRVPSPRTRACTGCASFASVSSAGSARLSSRRCSANATGHQRTCGWPARVEHRGVRAADTPLSRTSAYAEPARAAVGVSRARRRRRRAAAPARRTARSARPCARRASAASRRRCRPGASAALPCTSGDDRPSAGDPADRCARPSPSRPSANAAICRTSSRIAPAGRSSGCHSVRQSDAADRERRPAAHSRFAVREQHDQIKSGGGGGGRGHRHGCCPRRGGRPAGRRGRCRRRIAAARAGLRAGESTPSSARSVGPGRVSAGGARRRRARTRDAPSTRATGARRSSSSRLRRCSIDGRSSGLELAA